MIDGNYIAGLIDGEGCFTIDRRGNYRVSKPAFACQFTMKLRLDDRPLLDAIQVQTGIGNCRVEKRLPNSCYVWSADAKSDAVALVELLTLYPLHGKKKNDFLLWAEAVRMWQLVTAGGGRRSIETQRIFDVMASLKTQLEQGRWYVVRVLGE